MKIYDPPLGPDSPLFVPMPENPDCPSGSPSGAGGARFLCTLAAGHKGDHVAHLEEDEVWAIWPAEEAAGG